MLALLIVPILAAGFLSCHIHPWHFYKLHRYEGQYLYLKSAEEGLKCFGLALGFALLTHNHYVFLSVSTYLQNAFSTMGAENSAKSIEITWLVILSTLTFLSTFLMSLCSTLLLRAQHADNKTNSKTFVIGKILKDSPLDSLLFELSLQKKDIMLSMDDRKVYVGRIINLEEPSATNGMDQEILMMPILSGYRDKDTLKITFTTHYSEVESEIYLTLRQGSIVSATEFSFPAYQTWNSNQTPTSVSQNTPNNPEETQKNPSTTTTTTTTTTRI